MNVNPKVEFDKTVVDEVLVKSRRRCCLCVFVRQDDSEKRGQIAHVNPGKRDGSADNAVFLCLEHHDLYDSPTSQSKGITEGEVRRYRDMLYAQHLALIAKPLWNVPHSQNPFFTGREETLERLHEALTKTGSAAVSQVTSQAISGLGGVGKTQIAVEYAYRRRDEYQAVFWVTASDRSILSSGYSEIAGLLDLPQKDLNDQQLVIDAVKRWLDSHDGWLLILDNADEPEFLPPFMPNQPKGRILITSRSEELQEVGIPKPLRLEEMPPDEALGFLLKRTGREDADDSEVEAAKSLAKELEYLPLALEQAAAYIVEKRPKFTAYLKGYETQRLKLLDSQKPLMGSYPKSVVTTWDTNFEAVGKASPAAADVLRLSAVLAPEPIPYEILTEGAGELGPEISEALAGCSDDTLVLDELLSHLSRYSLIRRAEDGWSVHRLVQAVVRKRMSEEEERVWAERAVNAVSMATPAPQCWPWRVYETLVPHQQSCIERIDTYHLETAAAAHVLNQAGVHLWERGRYSEAERLYRRALEIREKILGPEHPDIAESLNDFGLLLIYTARYEEAEPLLRRAVEMRTRILGPADDKTAISLNNLALLLNHRGEHDADEPLFRRALKIWEKVLGPEHPYTATALNNLAKLLRARGDLDAAEPLIRRALEIREKVLGPEHPDTADSLNSLAELLRDRGDLDAAEPLIRRALEIWERTLGPEHPDTALCRRNLEALLERMKQGE